MAILGTIDRRLKICGSNDLKCDKCRKPIFCGYEYLEETTSCNGDWVNLNYHRDCMKSEDMEEFTDIALCLVFAIVSISFWVFVFTKII